jgi:hypothetical protein
MLPRQIAKSLLKFSEDEDFDPQQGTYRTKGELITFGESCIEEARKISRDVAYEFCHPYRQFYCSCGGEIALKIDEAFMEKTDDAG